ncbi:MAG: xanthine dehydrogenase family protein molybdopterin-binding subunit [Gammaproteobacteria bacterium]|nr:xanthine dehydrogenase family protein molybdopterin-binding subunit [Gammaproteobacteria bacterium]
MLGRIDTRHLVRPELSRRGFLKVIGLSGAGFMIGCSDSSDNATDAGSGAAAEAQPVTQSVLGPFVRIGSDNTVTVIVKHLDKGQGVTTGLPTIVAEELDADWSQMHAEFSPADPSKYNNLFFGPFQGTGGSSSIANSWMQLRQAAAGARAMLVDAAAARWQVPAGEITVAGGVVSHAASDNEASFGELAAAAADMTPPAEPALKDPQDFTLIGTRVPRLDSNAKTDGSAKFTLDLTRPGMLTALVSHPPKFGATVESFDASAALDVPGVTDVVQVPTGIAVLADNFWAAKKGRDALEVTWSFAAAEQRSSGELMDEYKQHAEQASLAARKDGDVETVFADADNVIRREYAFPYLAHAPMEPMDCIVELREDACEIWTGSQLQTGDQYAASQITGLQPEQIIINTQFAGGSFGRRAVPTSDYVSEAVTIAKAIDGRAPVKLMWTREDEMTAGYYRPMSYHLMEAAFDGDGNISAWRHRLAMQSIMTGTAFEGLVQDGIDSTSVEGSKQLPYAIPNLQVDLHTVTGVGVPVLWWRSVGHTHNGFVTEAFFDELAAAAGKDAYELRRDLLKDHPRHLGVLELAAEKAGWGEDLGPGRGRGIAVHESFSSFVAEVVDVTVGDDGGFTVDRVVCAVDCGIAINPDIVKAQMEGGIGYALSAALREAVTLTGGQVDQRNFDSYRPLRIDEMPDIEVHIVPSAEAPTGVGEPGVPPLAPALANALADATGKRVYRMPIGEKHV